MPMKKNRIILRCICGSTTPADSTSYYFGGMITAMQTTDGIARLYMPRSGILTNVSMFIVSDTNTTSEDITFNIRKNSTTDYLFATKNFAGGKTIVLTDTPINIPVLTTDYIEIKVDTPAWVTNPTTWRGYVTITLT